MTDDWQTQQRGTLNDEEVRQVTNHLKVIDSAFLVVGLYDGRLEICRAAVYDDPYDATEWNTNYPHAVFVKLVRVDLRADGSVFATDASKDEMEAFARA